MSIGKRLSNPDVHCFLIPVIQPYLGREVYELDERELVKSLLKPVSLFIFILFYIYFPVHYFLSSYSIGNKEYI